MNIYGRLCQGTVGKPADSVMCPAPAIYAVAKTCTCKTLAQAMDKESRKMRAVRIQVCAQHLAQAVRMVGFECGHFDHDALLVTSLHVTERAAVPEG